MFKVPLIAFVMASAPAQTWGQTSAAAQVPRLELTIEQLQLPASPLLLKQISLTCGPWVVSAAALECKGGEVSLQLPGWGRLSGSLRLSYQSSRHWTAEIGAISVGNGRASLRLRNQADDLLLTLDGKRLPVEGVLVLANALGFKTPALSAKGAVDVALDARNQGQSWKLNYRIAGSDLSVSESSGRYASEHLSLQLSGVASRRGDVVTAAIDLSAASGQLYVEPVFNDFKLHPIKVHTALRWQSSPQALDLSELTWDQSGVMQGSGDLSLRLGKSFAIQSAKLRLLKAVLPGFLENYVGPFLAGTRLEGMTGTGAFDASAVFADGAAHSAEFDLADITLDLPRLESGLRQLHGKVHWDAAQAEASQLSWTSGRLQKVPLGGSELAFVAQGRDFELVGNWRQPMLEGALNVRRLRLRKLGDPAMDAGFEAEIEPINLTALCQALGWPLFSGQLSGRLPGLTVRDQVLSLDGELKARVFDGEVSVDGLRLIEPWGVLPRLTANLHLRNLDLLPLTGAFSFGRIEGRMSGDVEALRLLAWKPVAFKARIYTPPGDDSRHRISQRAIDNISSIGGGPSGLLSRGALSLFKDFSYDRIGWSCTLDNGICTMGGLGPTDDGNGYVLVKGKWLPRIDIVGYATKVNWATLLEQLKNVRASEAKVGP
jgi:hypothetical protein